MSRIHMASDCVVTVKILPSAYVVNLLEIMYKHCQKQKPKFNIRYVKSQHQHKRISNDMDAVHERSIVCACSTTCSTSIKLMVV